MQYATHYPPADHKLNEPLLPRSVCWFLSTYSFLTSYICVFLQTSRMSRTVRLRDPGASLISALLLTKPSHTVGHVTNNRRLASSASQPNTQIFPHTPKPQISSGLGLPDNRHRSHTQFLRLGGRDAVLRRHVQTKPTHIPRLRLLAMPQHYQN